MNHWCTYESLDVCQHCLNGVENGGWFTELVDSRVKDVRIAADEYLLSQVTLRAKRGGAGLTYPWREQVVGLTLHSSTHQYHQVKTIQQLTYQ